MGVILPHGVGAAHGLIVGETAHSARNKLHCRDGVHSQCETRSARETPLGGFLVFSLLRSSAVSAKFAPVLALRLCTALLSESVTFSGRARRVIRAVILARRLALAKRGLHPRLKPRLDPFAKKENFAADPAPRGRVAIISPISCGANGDA